MRASLCRSPANWAVGRHERSELGMYMAYYQILSKLEWQGIGTTIAFLTLTAAVPLAASQTDGRI